jgi:hypothetical protein
VKADRTEKNPPPQDFYVGLNFIRHLVIFGQLQRGLKRSL